MVLRIKDMQELKPKSKSDQVPDFTKDCDGV